jgi:hypothetical protein
MIKRFNMKNHCIYFLVLINTYVLKFNLIFTTSKKHSCFIFHDVIVLGHNDFIYDKNKARNDFSIPRLVEKEVLHLLIS